MHISGVDREITHEPLRALGKGRVESSSRFGAKSLLLARRIGRKLLVEVCGG